MTIIFGTLTDVGGQLAQGRVTVSSLMTRPAHGDAATVITTDRHVLPLRNGAFESPELDPGPTLVEATTGGSFESWQVTLPEDGRHDLATLIESNVDYSPGVIGRVEAAAADANRAAQAAGQSATRAGEAEAKVITVVADGAAAVRTELRTEIDGVSQARVDAQAAQAAAEAAAAGVAADASAAGSAADRAEAAAGVAESSAEAAGVSAGEAAGSATAAGASATAAAGDAAAVSGARDAAAAAADAAQGSATTAAADADRAESAAAGVDQVVSDAAVVLAGEIADDVAASQAARTGAESARDQAVGAASTVSTKADEAAASAATADGRATDAENAVASIATHATSAEDAASRAAASESNAAGSATEAQGHAEQAATEAGAAAQIAAQEKIAELVGDAPHELDTIYELAHAFEDRGDAIAAIHDALANRVTGTHSSVISSTVPGAGTPTNQITFVVEG